MIKNSQHVVCAIQRRHVQSPHYVQTLTVLTIVTLLRMNVLARKVQSIYSSQTAVPVCWTLKQIQQFCRRLSVCWRKHYRGRHVLTVLIASYTRQLHIHIMKLQTREKCCQKVDINMYVCKGQKHRLVKGEIFKLFQTFHSFQNQCKALPVKCIKGSKPSSIYRACLYKASIRSMTNLHVPITYTRRHVYVRITYGGTNLHVKIKYARTFVSRFLNDCFVKVWQ